MSVPAVAGAQRFADIQGLRAVAVLLVIAFHAGLPVPGGFIGVDVFFVISGFVITLLILREWSSERGFSLRRFYIRRFKRLTPALAVTVAVVCVASVLLLSPLGPQQNVAATGAGALVFLANYAIVATSGDYFDDPAADNPLLNTWSLSVEEQFYLVFPAVLLLALLIGRRMASPKRVAFVAMGLLSVVSFALAVVGYLGYGYVLGDWDWLLGFYSPLTRAWEFGGGVLLALANRTPRSRPVGAATAAIGLAMIAVGALVITDTTLFPGPMTLLPVLGAALAIHGNRSMPQPISRALSIRPMVHVGDWSYSLYLWHWPLIVFSVLLFPNTWWVPILAAAVSFLPAIASFRFVEEPLRRWSLPLRRAQQALLLGIWAGALALAGLLWGSAQSGWIPPLVSATVRVRYPGDLDGSSTGDRVDNLYNFPCGDMPTEPPTSGPDTSTCRQSKPEGPLDVAILGDSHAWQLYPALAEALPRGNVALLDARGLPAPSSPASLPAIEYLQANPPAVVLLSVWWQLRGVPGDLFTTISALEAAGSEVILLNDFPAYAFQPEGCYSRASPLTPLQCDMPRELAESGRASYEGLLELAIEQAGAGTIANTFPYFCTDDVCSMAHEGDLIYFNDNHLNFTGSRYAVDRLLKEYPQLAASSAGL